MVVELLLLPIILLAAPAVSFTTPGHFSAAKPALPSLILASRSDLESREFQLEELEDREGCETRLWLNANGTVTLGETSGPKFAGYRGDWHVIETASEADRPFRLRLTREYEMTSSVRSNLGDVIAYEVEREFWGNVETAGDGVVSVAGRTHGNPNPHSGNVYIDERAVLENEIGDFTMIHTVAGEGSSWKGSARF